MTAAPSAGAPAIGYLQHSTSFLEVERVVALQGMSADLRHYGWTEPREGVLEPPIHYLEFGLSRRGQTSMIGPGERCYSPPGAVTFMPAGTLFRTRCAPSDHHTLCVAFDRARLHAALDGEAALPRSLPHSHDLRDPRVERCLHRLHEEMTEPGFASAVLTEAVITTLMVELHRHLRRRSEEEAEPGSQLAGWRKRRIKERIEAELAGPLSISGLAADCGLSPRHLIRTFKTSEGVTLGDYIARARIDRARQLLGDRDIMMKQIAGECGFASAAAFSAAFRRAIGCTPREFRDRAGRSCRSR
ncbi:MAG: helix-turn-helix domain-containing protein [Janthinobacterium lividum]